MQTSSFFIQINQCYNERNQLTIVKEIEFDEIAFEKIDSIIEICHRDCHNKFYHTFNYEWSWS